MAEALPIDTVSGSASSTIVPVPGLVPTVALVGAERSTVKVSFGSLAILSSIVWTVRVWLVTPAAKVRSPLAEV